MGDGNSSRVAARGRGQVGGAEFVGTAAAVGDVPDGWDFRRCEK